MTRRSVIPDLPKRVAANTHTVAGTCRMPLLQMLAALEVDHANAVAGHVQRV